MLSAGRHAGPLALALLAGALLGVLDLVVQINLPYPGADLGNSRAVWAVAAYTVSFWLTSRPMLGAILGVAALVVAVETYYVAAVLTDYAGADVLWARSTQTWLELAVLTGVVFGAAGSGVRSGRSWPVVIGSGLAGGVMLGEALYWFRAPAFGAPPASIAAALGILIVAALGRVTTQPRAVLAGYALAVPIAIAFAVLFEHSAGF